MPLPAQPPMALLILVTALGPFSMQIFLPALPAIQTGFAISAGDAQWALSLSMVSIALATLAYGPLSDRYGRRPPLLGGLLLCLAGSAISASAPSIGWLVLGRILQAAGGASGMVLARAIAADVYGRERAGEAIATITLAMVFAPMIAPLIGGLLTDHFGWRWNFLTVSAALVPLLAATYFRLPESNPHRGQAASVALMLKGFARLLSHRRFCGYAFQGACSMGVFFAFISGAPYVMTHGMGQSATDYGLWFVLLSLGFMAGSYVTRKISGRFGIDRLIRIGCRLAIFGTAIVLALALAKIATPLALFGPTILVAFANGLCVPSAQAGAVIVEPKAAGAASGLAGFVQMALAALISQAVGWTQDGSALPLALHMLFFAVAALGFARLSALPAPPR